MREQIAPLAAAFTLAARRTCRKEASMLEGSTISSMIYPTLRINYCLLLLIRGLQSPGPGFFEPFPAYQTLPDTLFFSFPALADRCYCGLPPSAPRWGQVPGVVRRLKFPFDCCSDETDVRVRIRGIVVRIRHRNTAIRVRVVVATIDHTDGGSGYVVDVAVICRGGTRNGTHRNHVHIFAMRHGGNPDTGAHGTLTRRVLPSGIQMRHFPELPVSLGRSTPSIMSYL